MTIPNSIIPEAPMANAIDDVKEWVLVPKEPTEAMYEAGYDATRKPDGFPQFANAGFVLGHSGTIYSAMIAAAPPSPAPSHDEAGIRLEKVDMVDFSSGYEVPAEPIWRLVAGGYCADFLSETGARNFLAAISPASQHTGWSDEAVELALAWLRGEIGSADPEKLRAAADSIAALAAASSIAPATGFEVKAKPVAWVAPNDLLHVAWRNAGTVTLFSDQQEGYTALFAAISPLVAKESEASHDNGKRSGRTAAQGH